MIALWLLVTALGVPATLSTLVVAWQLALAGARPRDGAPVRPSGLRVAVIIPAHDEGAGIAGVVGDILPQLQGGDRCLVVADNCTDDTATRARIAGADVAVRTDADRRGKGFALAHGLAEATRADAPDAVLLFDADCRVAPGAVDALLGQLHASGQPVQGLYLMQSPPGAGVSRRFAEFAWRIRNQLRPRGWHRLGWPCQLMGSGIAMFTHQMQSIPLAHGSIVEDMQMGLDLARQGAAPSFCEAALVTSNFPESDQGAETQRTRWQHGHLHVLLSEGPRLLRHGLLHGRGHAVAMALDLMVPPLVLLGLLDVGFACAGGFGAGLGAGNVWWLTSVPLLLLLLAVGRAWHLAGRELVGARELLALPGMILGKLPMYWRFLFRRETRWIRTRRD